MIHIAKNFVDSIKILKFDELDNKSLLSVINCILITKYVIYQLKLI